jgi:hypothetical protein
MTSAANELTIFAGARLRRIEEIDLGRAAWIRSAHVIAHMADRVRMATTEDAAKVVDGFWDYVADVRSHYRPSSNGPYLVIPRFGTFRLVGDRLRFRSFSTAERGGTPRPTPKPPGSFLQRLFGTAKPEAPDYPPEIDRAGVGTGWEAKGWETGGGRLSVKRRIARHAAGRGGLDPELAAPLLDAMLGTCLFVFDRVPGRYGPSIAWARRGTMRRIPGGPPGQFGFVATWDFRQRLRTP